MKFHVRQNELQSALNIIKTSKALGKPEEELFSMIKIETFKENEKSRIRFTSTTTVAWASSCIREEYFEELIGDSTYTELFGVEEYDSIYIDGHTLINVINGYPDNTILNFTINKKSKGDTEISNLVCECTRNNKKEKKKSTFLVKIPSYFNETPPNEVRESATIPAREFADAVNSVEFASSTDDTEREFWGVFIEIRGMEVSACATDKQRICWYDKEGLARDTSSPSFNLNPIKPTLVSAIKGLDLKKNLTIERGDKFTVLRQDDRWHAIPNVIKSSISNTSFDWRSISKNIHDSMVASIRIPRKTLKECAKLASSAGGGSGFGIRIHFDTNNKKTKFIVEKIEGGGVMCSHEEEILLEDNQFDCSIDSTIVLGISAISEIASRYNCDQVIFRILDNSNPIEIVSEKDHFRFITGTIDSGEDTSSDEENEENLDSETE